MRQTLVLCVLAALLALIAPAGIAQENAWGNRAPPEEAVPIALLVDISSGQVLHARNADRRFVPASITKTMSAFVAFELIEEGRLDPQQRFVIRPETHDEWYAKGSNMFIPKNRAVLVDDLLMGIMTVSANDGAVVLAEGAAGSVEEWTELMNEKARELGMTNSHFANPNGWMDEGSTFTTANDLATLAEAMIRRHPEKFARYVGNKTFRYDGLTQRNYDPLIGEVEGADGIKTGFTNESGFGFLGTVKRGNQRLVMVLAGTDSGRIRNYWAKRYIEWGFSAFDRRTILEQGEKVAEARVQDGSERRIALVTDRPVTVNLPDAGDGKVTLSVRYDGPLRAPIKEGSQVATLVIRIPGMDPASVPLFAADEVERAGLFERIANALAGWLG